MNTNNITEFSKADATSPREKEFDFSDYLRAVGPAIVISAVVVGPGSVTTASTMGANYSYSMLWVVILASITAFFYQLPAISVTLTTGRGIMECVQMNYGKKVSLPFYSCLLFGTCVFQAGNFVGGAMAMNYLVPQIPLLIWTVILVLIGFCMVWIGKYNILENFTKVLVFIMVASFIITALGSAPSGNQIVSEGFAFRIPNGDYMLVLAIVATTMVPDIPISLSALIKNKYCNTTTRDGKLSLKDKKTLSKIDLVVGCSVTALITISIIVCSAANLFPKGITVSSAQDMAAQLTPILGRYAGILFSLGLWAAAFSSGMFRIQLMPMLYNQATGQEEDMSAKRSRVLMIITSAVPIIIVAIFGKAPASLIITAQAINGVLLPFICAVVWKISSDRKLLGDKANSVWLNVIFSLLMITTILLSVRTFLSII